MRHCFEACFEALMVVLSAFRQLICAYNVAPGLLYVTIQTLSAFRQIVCDCNVASLSVKSGTISSDYHEGRLLIAL